MLEGIGAGRKLNQCSGGHAKCAAFVLSQLDKGKLVIASWCSRHGDHHWILIIGSEGFQTGARFTPSTFLALDPSVEEPRLCGYNGRLDFAVKVKTKSHYHPYLCLNGYQVGVKLTSALSIGSDWK